LKTTFRGVITAAEEPIFDYHCHLIPKEIADNRRFNNLAEVWLGGDHYKWRAMRANGVDERFITGNAEPWEKFKAWADTIPRLMGNPLYHWTHLELQRYFDIYDPLNRDSAPAIWKAANERLEKDSEFSVYGIFNKFKVHTVGTTDDPVDTLEWHEQVAAAGGTRTRVRPSFRPDKALNIEKPEFVEYIQKLGAADGKPITNLAGLLSALKNRIALFDQRGCRASDHGLDTIPFATSVDGSASSDEKWEKAAAETFAKALAGETVSERAGEVFKSFVLCFLGAEYHDRGWVMQLHLNAIRSTNSRMFRSLGPDTGFDAVHDHRVSEKLAQFLDVLEGRDKLPKTILYSLNHKDYYTMGTIMGSFQGGGIPGKMQLGSAWWFCDHKDGMEEQMKILGSIGLLSRFIGMLTDSRSFLSYPRHEYFRRILCNILGTWAEAGEIPNDKGHLENMVRDIAFRNAERYFA
jgi:glucuronate isomerase